MAAEDKLFKLQQYQRTQQLIHDLNFEKATQLPLAAGAEGSVVSTPQSSSSYLLRRTQDSVSKQDMSLIRGHLKVMSEIDPANPYYSSLIERINHGDHLQWSEFEDAINRFSSQEYYTIKLQDEINNEKINLELQGELPEEPKIIDVPEQENNPLPPEPQDNPSPDQSLTSSTTPSGQEHQQSRPRYVQPQKPSLSPEAERKLTEVNRSVQQTKAKLAGENPPQISRGMEDKLSRTRQSMQRPPVQPSTETPQLSDKMSQRLNSSTRSMRRPPLQRTPSQPSSPANSGAILNSRNRRKALASLLKGRAGSGFGIPPWLSRSAWNMARGAGRLAWNLGSSLARAAINALTRAAAQLLPRLGAQAALQAGRGLLMGAGGIGAALVTTGALAIWVGVIAMWVIGLGILWLYNDMIANSECNKPAGEMKVEKRITNSLDPNDPSIRNEDPEIRYLIEMSYELLCKNRKLETVTVTDKIPEGVRYDPDHPTAKSGFRNDDSSGPEGVYDPTTKTLTWTFTNFPTLSPVYVYFNAQRETTDSWVVNEATVKYTVGGPTGGRIINSPSQSFEQAVAGAAQNVNMPPSLLKAILSVEAPGVLEYSEEEFRRFSTPGWWEGADQASLKRGYAYNTCADPRFNCGAGNDVQGVAQFLSTTWDSIAPRVQELSDHKVDRRNATDAIYGSAIYNRDNAEIYVGSSNVEWKEDVVRAVARMYCAGPGAAKNPAAIRVKECGWDGKYGYDDFVWRNYQLYSGAQ